MFVLYLALTILSLIVSIVGFIWLLTLRGRTTRRSVPDVGAEIVAGMGDEDDEAIPLVEKSVFAGTGVQVTRDVDVPFGGHQRIVRYPFDAEDADDDSGQFPARGGKLGGPGDGENCSTLLQDERSLRRGTGGPGAIREWRAGLGLRLSVRIGRGLSAAPGARARLGPTFAEKRPSEAPGHQCRRWPGIGA